MTIEVFDPELCCTTGVCGSAPDPGLIRAQETFDRLKAEGAIVRRFQLSRHAEAFTANASVYRTLLESGTGALPMIAIDGALRFVGQYPTYDQVQRVLSTTG